MPRVLPLRRPAIIPQLFHSLAWRFRAARKLGEYEHFGRRQRLAHGGDQKRPHNSKAGAAKYSSEPCRIFKGLPDADELFHAGEPPFGAFFAPLRDARTARA